MSNKRIIFCVTRKYMRLNRRRTTITFIGVLFMVILMTCVFVGKDTAVDYLERVAELDKGGWHVIAYELDGEKAAGLRGMDDTELVGFSRHVGYADFEQSASQDTPYLEIKAYTPEVFELMNITVVEGRLPENDHELVITESAIEDGSAVRPGDKVSSELFGLTVTGINPDIGGTVFPFDGIEVKYGETVEVPIGFPHYAENPDFREDKVYTGEQGDYTVVGVIRSPYFEKRGSAGYTALTCLPEEAVPGGAVNAVIRLDLDKADSARGFIAGLQAYAGEELRTETNEFLLSFSAKGSDATFSGLAIVIEVFFAVLIVGASLILIYNVFNISYGERTKYLGMLSSVGATRRQKRWSIYYEVLCLLIPALPLGILLGLGVVLGGMAALKPHIGSLISSVQLGVDTDIPVRLSVSAVNLIVIAAASLVTVMLSALIPAVKVGKIGPVESIRGGVVKTKKHFKTKLGLMERGSAEALLAVSGTTRCRYLTKGIVRSIAIFGVLVIVTLFGARAVIAVTEQKTDVQDVSITVSGYDYFLYSASADDTLYNAACAMIEGDSSVTGAKAMDQIFMGALIGGEILSDAYWETLGEIVDWYDLSPEYKSNYLENTAEWGETINLLILDDEDFLSVGSGCGADLSAAESGRPSILLFDHKEMSTDTYGFEGIKVDYRYFEVDRVYDLQKGDDVTITLVGADDMPRLSIPFAGFVDNDALEGLYSLKGGAFCGVVNRSAADAMLERYDASDSGYGLIDHYLLFSADGESEAGQALLRQLSDLCAESDHELTLGTTEMLSGMGSLKQAAAAIIRILAYCFIVLVSVICLLNLYNSVKGRAAERVKETAVLRSMGMTGQQLTRMRGIENLMLLARGYAAAAVISGALILLLGWLITQRFGNIALPVPWLLAAITALVIGAALAVMTRFCSRPSERSSITETIRSETV